MPETAEQPHVVFVIGTIAPYTHRLYERLGAELGGKLTVLCCAEIEPTRHWVIDSAVNYRRVVMKGLRWHRSDLQSIYLNPQVLWTLTRLRPDILIIGSFSPTMVLASVWAWMTGTAYGVSTDGVPATDPGQRSRIHRILRRLLIPRADIGIGAGQESLDLLRSYGLPDTAQTLVSPVLPAWDFPGPPPTFRDRPFDLFFCGRLDERKGIPFLIRTLDTCAAQGHRPSLRIAGEGPLRNELQSALTRLAIPHQFDGYLQTHQLGEAFASAKLFLFPTRFDPWGLVVNEALQCGTPVISSPHAAASRQLVAPFMAGHVLELDPLLWAERIIALLGDGPEWNRLQANAATATATASMETTVAAHLAAYRHATFR